MIRIVVAAFVFHSDKILLIKQIGKERWVPPGGHVDHNETLGYALRRELKEETNLVATFYEAPEHHFLPEWENDPLPFLIQTKPDKHGGRCTQLDYAGTVYDPSTLKIQESELSHAHWFSINEVPTHPELHQTVKDRIAQAWSFLVKQGVR